MRSIAGFVFALLVLAAACAAQNWEVGGLAGYGAFKNVGLSSPVGSASTGFKPGAGFGAVVGQNLYPRISGEMRYTYAMSDLKLSAAGQEVTFAGRSHIIHYDLLFHGAKRGAPVRPFVAAGGGLRLYRGTGAEAAYQPLNNYAILTRTQEVKPLVSVGAGVKWTVAPRVIMRVEFRDYMTPFPKQVIAPVRGDISGWIHDFVPLAGITFSF
jgi:hypothetical protein